MSTYPTRLEARVSAQERRQINLDARVEEVAEDTTASFKQLSEYLGKIEENITEIKTTMATKDDLAAMENRILDTFKQLLTTINTPRPPSQ